MRFRLAYVSLFAIATSVCGQNTQEERDFQKKRWIKSLLDPESKNFSVPLQGLFQRCRDNIPLNVNEKEGKEFKECFGVLIKFAEMTKGQPDSDKHIRSVFTVIMVVERAQGTYTAGPAKKNVNVKGLQAMTRLVPDSFMDLAVRILQNPRKGVDMSALIEFFGTMGNRSRKAVPRLQEIRDGKDDGLALEAFKVLKKIQDKK